MTEIFLFPFMQRAILSGILVALLLGALGVFANIRQLSFLGDGVAHASLAGIALALLVGWMPTVVALAIGVLIACGIFLLERHSNISGDAAIGILFTTGMALGVIILHYTPGFQPELVSFLFGNILAVQTTDLILTGLVGVPIMLVTIALHKKITFVLVDEEGAYLSGLQPWKYILTLYILISMAIVLSIKLVGIVLVSALLITPSAIAQQLTRTFFSFQWLSVLWSFLIVIGGIIASVWFDLPSGATIVVFGTLCFLLAMFHNRLQS